MKLIQIKEAVTPEYALESIVSTADKSMRGMISSVANYFPELRNKFEGTLKSLENHATPKWVGSVSILKRMLSDFAPNDVVSMDLFQASTRLHVRVPEGFTGNLKEYIEYLDRAWTFLQTEAIPSLDVYYALLASFASNKEAKISLVDTSKKFVVLEDNFNQLVKESQSYFGKNLHNNGKAKLGDTFSSYDEFKEAANRITQLAGKADSKQFGILQDKIKRIVNVLNLIVDEATKGNYDRASYESVKGLATGIYALANIIEFYPVTVYRIYDVTAAMAENRNNLRTLRD